MQTINKKIRLIFLPFWGIAISFIVLYTFLNWFLLIRTNILSIKQDLINVWFPLGLPWISILIWFRPRTKLLKNKNGKGNLPFLFQLIAALTISVSTIIAQEYMEALTGKLTSLQSINQINQQGLTKYYTLKNYYIDKKNVGFQQAFKTSGKYNEHFDMNIYIALPILENQSDTLNSKCFAWMGLRYSKQISNRLNDSEKESEFRKFADETLNKFNQKDINQFIYLERVGNSDEGDNYKEAITRNLRYNPGSNNIFIAVNEPFENRLGSKLGWIFGVCGIGGGIMFILLLFSKFESRALKSFESGNSPKNKGMHEFISLLIPTKEFFITPIIVELNILIFIIMVFAGLGFISFKGPDLLNWGANFGPSVINGEWWRLLTSMFLHGGLIHLVSNMFVLFFAGIILEPLLGKVKYALVYLLTGIFASYTSILWHEATVSIGASGAIFGLYGLLLTLILTKALPPDFGKALLKGLLFFIGYNLLVGLIGGIDNAAHIGGLVSGFVIGFILYPTIKNNQNSKPYKKTRQKKIATDKSELLKEEAGVES